MAIIATREEEIKNFTPRTYYGLQAKTKRGLMLTWQDQKGNTRSFSKEHMEKRLQQLQGKSMKVERVEKQFKKKFSPQLYDLTELQRDANRIFGFFWKTDTQSYAKII
ncbi:DNA topoisomerase [Virgibacillus soli]|uniref:DNA topoisomerase n=1 Tax=Paracerasibacillus soli TaxID=480284 RepID=A0ABU5CRK7_9BACI|nr:DNA topoisomerase [Virgibacillus soli]MDY0409007.1 DNA topoisomerase [Virgibacillus soli]